MRPTSKSKKKGGRKGWTTPAQLEFLREHIPMLVAHRGRGNLSLFWNKLYNGWFERWPEQPDLPEGGREVRVVVQLGAELIYCLL